jgi:hypothetical protein
LPGHGLTGVWPRAEYTVEAYADFIEVPVDTLNLDQIELDDNEALLVETGALISDRQTALELERDASCSLNVATIIVLCARGRAKNINDDWIVNEMFQVIRASV